MSAIADMVAPVVLITVAVIFINGLMTTLTTLGERVLAMDRERTGILRGPHGEMLDEDSVPPVDRDLLTQLRDLTPLMIRVIQRLRRAVLIMWISIGLLVLSVAAIAVGVTAPSEAFAFAALALVLAGVGGLFAGVIMVIGPMAKPTDAAIDAAARHMGVHG